MKELAFSSQDTPKAAYVTRLSSLYTVDFYDLQKAKMNIFKTTNIEYLIYVQFNLELSLFT